MTTDLLPSIERIASEALETVSSGGRVYVEGPVGAGRNSLLSKIVELDSGAVVLELLPLADSDSPVVALLEIAGQLGGSGGWPTWQSGSEDELHAIAMEAGRHLADAKRSLVIRMPDNWAAAEGARATPESQPSRARTLLSGLFQSAVAVALIADAAVTPSRLGFHPKRRVLLPHHTTRLDALDAVDWGSYRAAFEDLGRRLRGLIASPLAWRLAVGARALGEEVHVLERHLSSAVPLPNVAQALVGRLNAHDDLRQAVRRFMALRRPVLRADACTLSAIPDGHQSLVLECIGYGEKETRVSTVLRTMLSNRLGAVEEGLHAGFAQHYSKADGAASPIGLQGAPLTAWCEKAHHLAHAGEAGADSWAALDLPAPNLYWDRARYLSQERRDYSAAAQVYQSCVERFPEDDYAWHYLGFNLDRAGGSEERVLEAYQRAVELNPEHPWWNSRLVTRLIASGRSAEAQSEWRLTVERVDPDGTQVRASGWLADNLHLWVCRAWLQSGRHDQARAVLELVPRNFTARGPLNLLRQRVLAGSLHARWTHFLSELEGRCHLTAAHAAAVRSWWMSLERLEPVLPLPAAHGTSEGEFQFAWSYTSLLLEVDIDPEGNAYWYGKDRETGESQDGRSSWQQVSDDLRSWLEKVANA